MEGPSAVHRDGGSGDVGGFGAGQPEDGGGDLVGLGDALERITLAHGLVGSRRIRRGVDAGAEQRRLDRAGQTVFTRMPNSAASIASALEAICSPAFEAQ